MFFTTFPLAARATVEFDVNTDFDGPIIESLIPDLYYLGQTSIVCNNKTFVHWCILGVFHAAVVFYIPCIAL
jgi:hypothetical protein